MGMRVKEYLEAVKPWGTSTVPRNSGVRLPRIHRGGHRTSKRAGTGPLTRPSSQRFEEASRIEGGSDVCERISRRAVVGAMPAVAAGGRRAGRGRRPTDEIDRLIEAHREAHRASRAIEQ